MRTFLTSAFRGADAVYTLLPPDPQSPDLRKKWDQEGEAIVTAIRDSGRPLRRLLEQYRRAICRKELVRLPGSTRRRNASGSSKT